MVGSDRRGEDVSTPVGNPPSRRDPRTGLPLMGHVGWEGARVCWPGVSDGAPEGSLGYSGPGHPVPGLSLRLPSSAKERGAEPS